MKPIMRAMPTVTQRTVFEAVQASGANGVGVIDLCLHFRRLPKNQEFRRRLHRMLYLLQQQGAIEIRQRRWVACATATAPDAACVAQPPRHDMRTLGTYVQGTDWMRSPRPGADDFLRIQSITFFNPRGQGHDKQ